jgi:hypothetical protein
MATPLWRVLQEYAASAVPRITVAQYNILAGASTISVHDPRDRRQPGDRGAFPLRASGASGLVVIASQAHARATRRQTLVKQMRAFNADIVCCEVLVSVVWLTRRSSTTTGPSSRHACLSPAPFACYAFSSLSSILFVHITRSSPAGDALAWVP